MTAAPIRIQRRRTKGWRMPPNTVHVGRPSYWGNPYQVGTCLIADAQAAVDVFKANLPRGKLRGKNLCCWCSLDSPCHADILLELANREDRP